VIFGRSRGRILAGALAGLGAVLALTLPTAPAQAQAVAQIAINSDGPIPEEITVEAGTLVRWTNTGSTPVSVVDTAETYAFPSVPPNSSVERRFDTLGRSDYRVTVSGQTFVGGISVLAPQGTATTAAPTPTTVAGALTTSTTQPTALAGTGLTPRTTLVLAAAALLMLGSYVLFRHPAGRHAAPVVARPRRR
jgi:plastocyanin